MTTSGFVLIVVSNVSKLVVVEASVGSELSRVQLIVEYLSPLNPYSLNL